MGLPLRSQTEMQRVDPEKLKSFDRVRKFFISIGPYTETSKLTFSRKKEKKKNRSEIEITATLYKGMCPCTYVWK